MRRIYHPDSGAFEFFQSPEEQMMGEIQKENKELKSEIAEIRKLLEERNSELDQAESSDLSNLNSDQLKEVCQELGVSYGNASKEGTLISKINESGKSKEEILKAIESIKE